MKTADGFSRVDQKYHVHRKKPKARDPQVGDSTYLKSRHYKQTETDMTISRAFLFVEAI